MKKTSGSANMQEVQSLKTKRWESKRFINLGLAEMKQARDILPIEAA